MDGVKVALGNRGMTVEAARQARKIGKSGEPRYICNWMSFTLPFAWPCVLSDRPPVFCWLSPGEEWDALT